MSSFDIAARPYIDCNVIFRRKGKIAFVKRQNTGWMDGRYGLPAGKVDTGEDYKTAAAREALEEAGVTVAKKDLVFAFVQHQHYPDMDWVTVYFEAVAWQGEPYNAEPEKASELIWLDADNLPAEVADPQRTALQCIANHEHYGTFGW